MLITTIFGCDRLTDHSVLYMANLTKTIFSPKPTLNPFQPPRKFETSRTQQRSAAPVLAAALCLPDHIQFLTRYYPLIYKHASAADAINRLYAGRMVQGLHRERRIS